METFFTKSVWFKMYALLTVFAQLSNGNLNSELVNKSHDEKIRFNVGPAKVTFPFERLNISKFIGYYDENIAAHNVKSFQIKAKDFIKQYVQKYKKGVEKVHPHLEEKEKDDAAVVGNEDFWSNGENVRSSHAANRSRRAVIFQDASPNLARTRRKSVDHESEGTFVIKKLNRATPQFYDTSTAIDINSQRINDRTLVFSIETEAEEREVKVYALNEKTLEQRLLFHEKAPDAVAVDVLKMKGNLLAFTTVNHAPQVAGSKETINTGSTLYRVNLSNKTFDKIQTIHLPFSKSSAFWTGMGEEANEIFLALAPEKTVVTVGKTSYSVVVPLYRWQGGYFDYVSQLPASNPQSVQHFSMFSHDYLAVANYQDDTGSTSVQSEIFKYQHKESRFVSFQRVQTFGAKDIKHFTFSSADERRQEHFIAIANNCKKDENGQPQFWVQSTIMKFGSTRFLPFKSFYSYGAHQFLPVKDGTKFFLAFVDFHGIRLLQYNGWTFVETFSEKFETQQLQQSSPFSVRLRSFNSASDGNTFFTVATPTQLVKNGMFGVSFETRNDHQDLVKSVKEWCDGANQQMRGKNLIALENGLKSAPKKNDSTLMLNGKITFVNGVKIGELKSRALRLGRGRSLDHNKFKELAGLEKNYTEMVNQMASFHEEMIHNVVWTNRDQEQEINAIVHFKQDVMYENDNLDIRHLKVKNSMGPIEIAHHLDNLIFLNQPHTLENIVTDTVIANDATLTTLNGHLLSDYAHRHPSPSSSKQIFTGNNQFLSTVHVTKAIQADQNFAGLSFTFPQFLLYEGNQSFAGTTMELTDSKVMNLYTRMLNGVDLFSMYNDAVLLSGGIITANKTFINGGVKMKKIRMERINQVDIESLYKNAIYINSPAEAEAAQTFTQPVTFENLEMESISPSNPSINDQFDVNFNFYKIDGQQYNVKKIKLLKATRINKLFVKNQLNNVNVLQDTNKLDLLLRNPTEIQHVKSKSLKSIHFTQNVKATQLVDDIDLSGWSNEQEITLTDNRIQGILTVPGHVEFEGGLLFKQEQNSFPSFKQNNFDVAHVLQNSARTDSEKLPGSCSLHFDSLQVLGNSDIRGKVNKVFPNQWVINSEESTQLDITAAKEFTGPVHITKDIGANALFGKKAEEAQERENLLRIFPTLLLDGIDQTITKEMAFSGKFRADQASCPHTVLDDVVFENILFKKGDQTVEGEITFRQPFKALGDVTVTGDVVTPLVNGIDINEHLKNTLRTNGDQVGVQRITAEAWHFDTLTVTEKTEIHGALSSSDVKSLYGDIIRKDGEAIKLDGVNLSFEQGAIMSRIEFIGHMNGIPSTEWGHAWLLSQDDQVVETMVEFNGALTVENFDAPSVNGVDIRQLSENIVRIDFDETLEDGTKINFKSPVTAESGITMPNGVNVNGVDLSKDVLLKNSEEPQVVTGKNTFQKGMVIKGNLDVKEIPGFDIINFAGLVNADPSAEKGGSFSSLLVKGNLELEQEPEVTTSVNGNNWKDLLNELWLKDKKVNLQSPVTFGRVVLQKGGTMGQGATLNNIDLKDFENNYASKTRNQKWLGEVTLDNVGKIDKLTSTSLELENNGKFNDVNLAEFYNSVLRYTGDQEIKASNFNADNLSVSRLLGDNDNGNDVVINSVNVKDLMTVSGENVVESPKTLKRVKAKNVVVSKDTVINGVHMGEWNAGAVKRTGTHDIIGPVKFTSFETTENVVVEGFVDNVKFDLGNVVTREQDQVIHNRVEIKLKNGKVQKPKDKKTVVNASGGVEFKGKVNNINVQDSISKMVFKNEKANQEDLEPIIIKGEMVFNAPVMLTQVTTEALIQGQNVTAMMDTMTRAHDQVHSKGFKANEQYSKLLSMTKRMLEVSERRAVFLDYFVLTQTIKVAASYVKVLRQVGYPAIAIGFKKSEQITTENWWSYSKALDYYQLQIGNRVQLEGKVTDVAELSQGSSNIFAFAVNNEARERPAQAHLDVLTTNNVQSFEINKSPDKLSKTFILKTVDVGTAKMRQAISQVIYSHEFKSVHSFNVVTQGKDGVSKLTSCMAATTKILNEVDSAVKIFCMDSTSDALETVQEIHLDSPSLTTSTTVPSSDATLLAVLTRSGHGQPEGLLEIWSYSHRAKSKTQATIQFSKQSCLPVFNAIGLDSMSTEDGKSFLAVASGALPGTEYQGSVFVYRYSLETLQFKKVQTLEVSHPMDVKLQWLKPSNEVLMYVLSQAMTNNVQVYKRQGLSGWSLVHQFTSENGKSLEVADFTVDGIYRAQLLVTSPTQTNIYAAEFMGVNSVVEEELMEMSQSNSVSTSLREFVDFDNL